MMMSSRMSLSISAFSIEISIAIKRFGSAVRSRSGRRSSHENVADIELALPDVRLVVEAVRPALVRADQVHDLVAAGRQELGDQAPVAAPPGCLGAHEAGSRLREGLAEGLLPRGRAHPRSVAPEGGHAQAREPLLSRLAAEAAAQLDRVPVGDPGLGQSGFEGTLVELRVPARARKAADVDERGYACGGQDLEQLLERTGTVADGKDAHVGNPTNKITGRGEASERGRSDHVGDAAGAGRFQGDARLCDQSVREPRSEHHA